ncbi:unannotated protein [freshwater metagenome]|uniref:Unannotated protein n=1 Tax=freshwater metagenome TaxID=449393 RepID=A0A6J7JYU4_9ZZZZ
MTAMSQAGFGSLRGLRVVEISTSVAGPLVGEILGDLGAEVIKVEQVGKGDDTRGWAPPSMDGESITFMSLNRNKASLELDYKTPQGSEVLARLLESADILVQNLRPKALAKAGFGKERLEELNPRLIYCEITGFGRTGPKSSDAAYDPLLQAYSGIVSMVPTADGSPVRVPLSILDRGSAMWAVIGIFDALRRRDQTGRGTHVETSLLQTAMSWLSVQLLSAAAGHEKRKPLGSGHDGVVPYGAFPVSDGYIFLSAGNQAIWERFLGATDELRLQDREGFRSNLERAANRELVEATVSDVTRKYAMTDLIALLEAARVPCSPVQHVEDMPGDPQVQALGILEPMPHPIATQHQIVNLPLTFNGDHARHQRCAPLLGEDTESVLASLGYGADRIAEFFSTGVVAHTQQRQDG